MSAKDKVSKWYKGLDRKGQKKAIFFTIVGLVFVLALLMKMCSSPAQGAIPVAKNTDRLSYASYVPTILAPVFKCEVLEISGYRLDNVKLPDRPHQGDTVNDNFRRQRTIASVTVDWSGVIYGQQATIPCKIVVAPV